MTHQSTYQDKRVWIIGASRGIGAALSKELALRGAVLALSARRVHELETLKATLSGFEHAIFPLDVCDEDSVITTSKCIHTKFGRLDSIIFLAAAYTPMKIDRLDMGLTHHMIHVNLLGAFHVVHAIIPLLQAQSYGQIALCGSVAGYVGLPGGQPYSATKAGIINLAESLRSELPPFIDIKLINPGFVRTDLTDKNDFDMPVMIEPAQAAFFIADGLLKKGFEVHFPKRFTFFLKLLRLFPYKLSLAIMRRFNR